MLPSRLQKRTRTEALCSSSAAFQGEGWLPVSFVQSKACGRSGPSKFDPAGGRMAVIEMRGGAEEAFLADLALVGARRQVGMRLARGLAFNLGKVDVALHGPPRATGWSI